MKTNDVKRKNTKISLKTLIKKLNAKDIWFFDYEDISFNKSNKSILIEGLPGIGNVGKIAVDFLIDSIKAKKIIEITSSIFPHSVFVNNKNLIELPKIEIYHKKLNNKNFFFLSGDIQPSEEKYCYEFSNLIINLLKNINLNEIITIGGIGFNSISKKPKIFCTGNNKELIKKYKINSNVKTKLYGVIGPIIGVSGLLVGLAEKQNIKSVCLLGETINHPLYLGITASREIIKLLKKIFNFKINTKELDKEIKTLETNMIIANDLAQVSSKKEENKKISYIG